MAHDVTDATDGIDATDGTQWHILSHKEKIDAKHFATIRIELK